MDILSAKGNYGNDSIRKSERGKGGELYGCTRDN